MLKKLVYPSTRSPIAENHNLRYCRNFKGNYNGYVTYFVLELCKSFLRCIMMDLELRLLESNAEEAEREEFCLILRSFKVTGQRNLNSAAAVTHFLALERQKKKRR